MTRKDDILKPLLEFCDRNNVVIISLFVGKGDLLDVLPDTPYTHEMNETYAINAVAKLMEVTTDDVRNNFPHILNEYRKFGHGDFSDSCVLVPYVVNAKHITLAHHSDFDLRLKMIGFFVPTMTMERIGRPS